MTEQEVNTVFTSMTTIWDKITPQELRFLYRILIAHGNPPICSACKKPITTVEDFSLDHVVAQSIGGADSIKNLTPMHTSCNVAKGSIVNPTYFVHVDPGLLKEMRPLYQDRIHKTVVQSHSDKPGKRKRRNHMRLRGGIGVGIESFFSR